MSARSYKTSSLLESLKEETESENDTQDLFGSDKGGGGGLGKTLKFDDDLDFLKSISSSKGRGDFSPKTPPESPSSPKESFLKKSGSRDASKSPEPKPRQRNSLGGVSSPKDRNAFKSPDDYLKNSTYSRGRRELSPKTPPESPSPRESFLKKPRDRESPEPIARHRHSLGGVSSPKGRDSSKSPEDLTSPRRTSLTDLSPRNSGTPTLSPRGANKTELSPIEGGRRNKFGAKPLPTPDKKSPRESSLSPKGDKGRGDRPLLTSIRESPPTTEKKEKRGREKSPDDFNWGSILKDEKSSEKKSDKDFLDDLFGKSKTSKTPGKSSKADAEDSERASSVPRSKWRQQNQTKPADSDGEDQPDSKPPDVMSLYSTGDLGDFRKKGGKDAEEKPSEQQKGDATKKGEDEKSKEEKEAEQKKREEKQKKKLARTLRKSNEGLLDSSDGEDEKDGPGDDKSSTGDKDENSKNDPKLPKVRKSRARTATGSVTTLNTSTMKMFHPPPPPSEFETEYGADPLDGVDAGKLCERSFALWFEEKQKKLAEKARIEKEKKAAEEAKQKEEKKQSAKDGENMFKQWKTEKDTVIIKRLKEERMKKQEEEEKKKRAKEETQKLNQQSFDIWMEKKKKQASESKKRSSEGSDAKKPSTARSKSASSARRGGSSKTAEEVHQVDPEETYRSWKAKKDAEMAEQRRRKKAAEHEEEHEMEEEQRRNESRQKFQEWKQKKRQQEAARQLDSSAVLQARPPFRPNSRYK